MPARDCSFSCLSCCTVCFFFYSIALRLSSITFWLRRESSRMLSRYYFLRSPRDSLTATIYSCCFSRISFTRNCTDSLCFSFCKVICFIYVECEHTLWCCWVCSTFLSMSLMLLWKVSSNFLRCLQSSLSRYWMRTYNDLTDSSMASKVCFSSATDGTLFSLSMMEDYNIRGSFLKISEMHSCSNEPRNLWKPIYFLFRLLRSALLFQSTSNCLLCESNHLLSAA